MTERVRSCDNSLGQGKLTNIISLSFQLQLRTWREHRIFSVTRMSEFLLVSILRMAVALLNFEYRPIDTFVSLKP